MRRKGKDYWGFIEVARLVLFVIWWPGEFFPLDGREASSPRNSMS